jgi:hypothetical protein
MIIKPLVNTLSALFDLNADLKFYLCYIERHSNTHKELLEALSLGNFTVVEVGQQQTKAVTKDAYIYLVTRSD